MPAAITLDLHQIREFCARNPILKLSLFGSVLRNDFAADSDVDMLVELDPEGHVGFFDMARMEDELSGIVRRKVDLRTPQELSRYFRKEVVESAEMLYVRR